MIRGLFIVPSVDNFPMICVIFQKKYRNFVRHMGSNPQNLKQ